MFFKQIFLRHSSFIASIILICFVVILYGGTVKNGFFEDDKWLIVGNKQIQSLSNLPKLFNTCTQEAKITCPSGRYYRPLELVVFSIIYQLNNYSSSPPLFHAVNIIAFVILSLLVFRLMKVFLPGTLLPFFTTLLFVGHPINTEVVNWVSAVEEIIMAILVLSMVLLYMQYQKTKKIVFLVFSLCSFLLAFLTKETSVLLVFFPLLLDITKSSMKISPRSLLRSRKVIIAYAIPLGFYLFIRRNAFGYFTMGSEVYHMSVFTRVLTAFSLYPRYLLKLFFPIQLDVWHQLFPTTSPDIWVVLGVILTFATFFVLYQFWRSRCKVLVYGISLILVPLFLVLVMTDKLGPYIFAERYLLIPSIGLALIVGFVAKKGIGRWGNRALYILIPLFIFYLITGSFLILLRNQDWKDEPTLIKSHIKINPEDAYFYYYYLGQQYFDNGDFAKAKSELDQALALNPTEPRVLYLLARIPKTYETKDIYFQYPSLLVLTEQTKGIKLESSNGFAITIVKGQKNPQVSFETYISSQKGTYGTLIHQGLAQIPNVDVAYVRFWNKDDVKLYEFFLFKKNTVLIITVSPADSPLMQDFDEIVKSMKIY